MSDGYYTGEPVIQPFLISLQIQVVSIQIVNYHPLKQLACPWRCRVPCLQNRYLFSETLACGEGYFPLHPRAVGQVDTGRTLPRQVSKPGAASHTMPLMFCFDGLRTTVKTHLQRLSSQRVNRSSGNICSILPRKEKAASSTR